MANVSKTPNKIVLIAGDAIQNLRSVLDHLVYELVSVGTGKTPFAKIYFPIADGFAKYSDQRHGKTKGMRPSATVAIDALEPYKGGHDTLWLIHKLNNIDKHRALLTAGSAFRSVDLGGTSLVRLSVFFQAIRHTLASPSHQLAHFIDLSIGCTL